MTSRQMALDELISRPSQSLLQPRPVLICAGDPDRFRQIPVLVVGTAFSKPTDGPFFTSQVRSSTEIRRTALPRRFAAPVTPFGLLNISCRR